MEKPLNRCKGSRAMAETCPHCGSLVEPARNEQGQMFCPLCMNTGRPAAQAPQAAPWGAPASAGWQSVPGPEPWQSMGAQTRANAPGAVAALVMGILAFFTWLFGIIFAVLALVFGYQAKRRIAESGGRLGGGGMAKAGRILGWVYVAAIPVVIVVAAMVFVLVTKLGGASLIAQDTAVVEGGESYSQAFQVFADGARFNYTVLVMAGGPVSTGFYPSDMDANPTSPDGWAEDNGMTAMGRAILDRGTYTLLMTCESADPCTIQYELHGTA